MELQNFNLSIIERNLLTKISVAAQTNLNIKICLTKNSNDLIDSCKKDEICDMLLDKKKVLDPSTKTPSNTLPLSMALTDKQLIKNNLSKSDKRLQNLSIKENTKKNFNYQVVSEVSGKGIMELQKFNLSTIERNLLTKISVAAQRTGYSYADTETLAFWCECTTRTIQRAISKLLKLELIAINKISYRSRQKVRCFEVTQLGKVSKNLYIAKDKKLSTKAVQKRVHKSSSVATNVAANVATFIEHKEYKEYNIKEKILKKKDLSFCEPKKSKEEILIEKFGFAKVQAAKEKLQAYEKRDGIRCFNAYLEKTIENADSDTRLDENYYANKTFVDQRYDFFMKNGFRMAYKSKNTIALDVNGYTETFNLRDSENAFRLNMKWFLEEKGGFVARR